MAGGAGDRPRGAWRGALAPSAGAPKSAMRTLHSPFCPCKRRLAGFTSPSMRPWRSSACGWAANRPRHGARSRRVQSPRRARSAEVRRSQRAWLGGRARAPSAACLEAVEDVAAVGDDFAPTQKRAFRDAVRKIAAVAIPATRTSASPVRGRAPGTLGDGRTRRGRHPRTSQM